MNAFPRSLQRRFARRVHSAAAALLLCLYAAAAWHGAGDAHTDRLPVCAPTDCAVEVAASPLEGHVAPEQSQEEAHGCALCTLLHAPATPAVPAALPVVATATVPAPAVWVMPHGAAPIGFPPSRAPPSLSA